MPPAHVVVDNDHVAAEGQPQKPETAVNTPQQQAIRAVEQLGPMGTARVLRPAASVADAIGAK